MDHRTYKINSQEERLFLEVTGQAPLELQPSSEVTFFTEAVNSEITFTISGIGEVTKLVLKQEEREMQARKIH